MPDETTEPTSRTPRRLLGALVVALLVTAAAAALVRMLARRQRDARLGAAGESRPLWPAVPRRTGA